MSPNKNIVPTVCNRIICWGRVQVAGWIRRRFSTQAGLLIHCLTNQIVSKRPRQGSAADGFSWTSRSFLSFPFAKIGKQRSGAASRASSIRHIKISNSLSRTGPQRTVLWKFCRITRPEIRGSSSSPSPTPVVEEAFWKVLQRCTGDIIGTCLSDEEMLPDAVAKAVEIFASDPEAGAITGDGYTTDENGVVIGNFTAGEFNLIDYLFRPLLSVLAGKLLPHQSPQGCRHLALRLDA